MPVEIKNYSQSMYETISKDLQCKVKYMITKAIEKVNCSIIQMELKTITVQLDFEAPLHISRTTVSFKYCRFNDHV